MKPAKPKILIVDDSAIMRAHIISLLQAAAPQAQILEAARFEEALLAFAGQPPTEPCTALLVDFILEGQTGLQLLLSLQEGARLQGMASFPRAAIMTQGGKLPAADQSLALQSGIVVLAKPTPLSEAAFTGAVMALLSLRS